MKETKISISLRSYLWRQRASKLALLFLVFLIFIAVFYPLLTNDQYGIVPYHATTITAEKLEPPLSRSSNKSWYYTHWLGTDDIGRDVLAGIFAATRVALLVAFFAGLFSLLIGGIIGLLAGFYGDSRSKYNSLSLVLLLLFVPLVIYSLCFYTISSSILILSIGFLLAFMIQKYTSFYRVTIPWDICCLKAMEIADSIPSLLILLVLLVVADISSAIGIGLIIAFIRWPSIARYLRADLQRVMSEDFIKSSRVMGISDVQQLLHHALPNAYSATLVSLAFGCGVSILLEASLSFLGLGMSAEQVTWGSLLSDAKDNIQAWWLVLFPGIMLFLAIHSFNVLADKMNAYHERA